MVGQTIFFSDIPGAIKNKQYLPINKNFGSIKYKKDSILIGAYMENIDLISVRYDIEQLLINYLDSKMSLEKAITQIVASRSLSTGFRFKFMTTDDMERFCNDFK